MIPLTVRARLINDTQYRTKSFNKWISLYNRIKKECARPAVKNPQRIDTTLSFIANDSVQLLIEHTIKQYAEKPWRVVFRSYAGRMQCTIKAPGESYSKLNAFTEKLRTIPSVAELYLSSLSTTVKESRISRLSYKIFNEHLDATSESQEQLANQIERKLREEGLDSLMVQMLKENESIHMVFTPTGKNHDFSLDITLDDGTKVSAKADKWQ